MERIITGVTMCLASTPAVRGVLFAQANINVYDMVANLGLSVALVVFFVYQAWKREQAMSVRITALEDFIRDNLVDLVRKQVATEKELTHEWQERPCLVRDWQERGTPPDES